MANKEVRKLNLFDIVDLAKAGYKKKDIDEILKKASEDKSDPEPAPLEQPPAENAEKDPAEGKEGSEDKEDDIDYKKLYEDKCAELEKAQKANTQTNLKNDTDDNTPSIDDIVRSFM